MPPHMQPKPGNELPDAFCVEVAPAHETTVTITTCKPVNTAMSATGNGLLPTAPATAVSADKPLGNQVRGLLGPRLERQLQRRVQRHIVENQVHQSINKYRPSNITVCLSADQSM